MGFDQYHEPPDELPHETRTFARMITSLIEEAEAISWYEQRMAVEKDKQAKAIMAHRREIRRVASAFVGEVAAILHLIETHDVVAMVEKALDASSGSEALPNLALPAFTIYTADAARLDELPLPVPRKIAYFYAQIASIRDDLTQLATEPVSESSVDRRTERIRRVLTELNDALTLGDDILRELRPLLSPKHEASLTRA